MAYNEIYWDFPQFSDYSVLNAINPAVCWNPPRNHPDIESFEVQIKNTVDEQWVTIGTTAGNFIRFPADNYVLDSSYQARIITITVNGDRSAFSDAPKVQTSPLEFDFTTPQVINRSDGTIIQNQRYLFLIF